jgi:hypothetical protein
VVAKVRARNSERMGLQVGIVLLLLLGFYFVRPAGHDNAAQRPTGGIKYSLHVEWRDLFNDDPLANGPAIVYTSASGRPIAVPHLGRYTKAEGEFDQDVITTIPPYIIAGPYNDRWKHSPQYRISCTIWKWDIGGAYISDGPHTITTPGLGVRCQAKP